MNELKPCPFCGLENGTHRKDCYMLLLGRNIDAIISDDVPPVTVEILDKAWNTRYERTCTIEGVEYDDLVEEFYFDLSCGHVYWGSLSEPPKFCVECGAKVVEE